MVVYRIQPHTAPRVAVLDLLERTEKHLVMSGRPYYGTQQIPLSWVRFMEAVPSDTHVVMNGRPVDKHIDRVRLQAGDSRLAERYYEVQNGGL